MSETIKDLNSVANIVGSLGLSIAAAQRALNVDYVENVERFLILATNTADLDLDPKTYKPIGPGATPTDSQPPKTTLSPTALTIIQELAPSRYEFSETTLTARMELSRHVSMDASAKLGINVGAFAASASFGYASSSDYKASAECTTVIRPVKTNLNLMEAIEKAAAYKKPAPAPVPPAPAPVPPAPAPVPPAPAPANPVLAEPTKLTEADEQLAVSLKTIHDKTSTP